MLIYSIIFIVSSLLYGLYFFRFTPDTLSGKQIKFIILIAIFLRVIFVLMPPTGSDDYHRYIWDGKVQVHGINPYMYAPNDSALADLHTETLPAKINFPYMRTIYFPVSQLFFLAAYGIGGHSFYGLKLLLLVCELLTIFFLYMTVKRLNLPPPQLLLYLFSPLVLFQILGDAHIDGLGVMLLAGALFFYIEKRHAYAALFFGLSLLVKPAALLLLPLFYQDLRKSGGLAFRFCFITTGTVAILLIPYSLSANMLGALGTFAKNWYFNSSFFMMFLGVTGNSQYSRYLCVVLLLLFFIFIYRIKIPLFEKMYFSFLGLFLFSPVVHPWYLAWLALFLPLTPKKSGIVYISLASLCIITVYNYQTYGVWKDYPIVLVIEYLPVIYLLVKELKSRRFVLPV